MSQRPRRRRNQLHQPFHRLWSELEDIRREQDRQFSSWAAEIATILRQPYPEGTLRDQVAHGRRVRKHTFVVAAVALGQAGELWSRRWDEAAVEDKHLQAAKRQRVDRTSSGRARPRSSSSSSRYLPVLRAPSAVASRQIRRRPLHNGLVVPARSSARPATLTYSRPRKRRWRPSVRRLAPAVAVLAILGGGSWFAFAHRRGASPSSPHATIPVACARVLIDDAKVFSAPNNGQVLVVKRKDDPITMPVQMPSVTGQDGKRYRQVRTPTRTASTFAWMLEETLVDGPCPPR